MMMRTWMLALGALTMSSGALAMPVSTFLAKADRLKAKGPLAMFSGDLKLLMNQIKGDAAALRTENKAAEAEGRRKAYCTPGKGAKISDKEILAAMNEVAPSQRAATTTKAALRSYFARRYPCRG